MASAIPLPASDPVRNAQADRAVKFINRLTHTKGKFARKRFDLRPWQENNIIRPMFGRLREDGTRQYRTVYVEIPRKNGKSEIAAGVALKCLAADGEQGGEVYSAAADKDQAAIVFNVAAQMVRNDPKLSERCVITDSKKTILYKPTRSIYKALSSEAFTKEGLNASAIIFDEVHAQPNDELWNVLTDSVGTREQPLVFAITTSGFDKMSLGGRLHKYAKDVRDGIVIDPSFLPVLYCLPQDADWEDEANWHLVNPALGDFRKLDEMQEKFTQAKAMPAKENRFRQVYLCQWTEQAVRWIPIEAWDACRIDITDEELNGHECYIGLDLASTNDLAAMVLIFPLSNGDFVVKAHFWCPEETAKKRRKAGEVDYDPWQKAGWITYTDGNIIDYDFIEHELKKVAERYRVIEVVYDRWNATQITTHLMNEGFTVVPFAQTFSSFNGPCSFFEKLVMKGTIKHDGNEVLRWNISNLAVAKNPDGYIRPDKAKSGDKIDGGVGLIMGLGRCLVAEDEGAPGVYFI